MNLAMRLPRRQMGMRLRAIGSCHISSDAVIPKAHYNLPSPHDSLEVRRLRMQYDVLVELQRGLYPPPLESRIKKSKTVVDLGCGTGLWAFDMAKNLPDCEVIGVDVEPPTDIEGPPNLRFIKVNAEQRLPFEDESVDMLNIRIVQNLSHYASTYPEVARVLKPGGIFNSVVPGYWWSPNGTLGEAIPELRRALALVSPRKPNERYAEWSEIAKLIRDARLFRDVSDVLVDIPMGSWMEDEDMKRIGRVMQEADRYLLIGWKQLLVNGYPNGEQLCREVVDAIDDPSRRILLPYHFIYGTRL